MNKLERLDATIQSERNVARLDNFLLNVSSTERPSGLFSARKHVVRCSNHEKSPVLGRLVEPSRLNRDRALRRRNGISARQRKKHYRGNVVAQRGLAVQL